MGKHGTIFLGRDKHRYGEKGIGWVDYDPDYECGGPPGTTGRMCPHESNYTSLSETLGKQNDDADRLLHIAIPSYRDRMCPTTLYEIYTKSVHPERIYVRVLQQNDPSKDIDCRVGYCDMFSGISDCPHYDQIEIFQVDSRKAEGPQWARGLLSSHIGQAAKTGHVSPQDFCLSTDSHMNFVPEWDILMIEMWYKVKNEYAILSTYVADTEQMKKENKIQEVPHLCMVTFTSNVRTHATKCARNLSRPKLTNAVWGAGLSFSKCHAELKVPVDPHTPGIFDGEEFNRAARFFTYGYDIYTPHRTYIFHNYNKQEYATGGMGWTRNTDYFVTHKSHVRLKTMIDMPGGETNPQKILELKQSKFGIGDRRTIDQLIEFSGIDLRNEKPSIDGVNRCGNVQWVPFEEHSKGVNFIPSFDENEQPLDEPDETSVWNIVGNAASNKNVIKTNLKLKIIGNESARLLQNPPLIDKGQIIHRPPSLPFIVKVTTFILVVGMMCIVTTTKGTGRQFIKKHKRRNL